uniref:Ig-like domain-containing protein n=1 Tax=Myotis myotis TaxID=51298 RepID=A0A7J7V3Y5_MYOMY|nr:hypothetical protein mMyoMyo1_008495 [Myotis myotis]
MPLILIPPWTTSCSAMWPSVSWEQVSLGLKWLSLNSKPFPCGCSSTLFSRLCLNFVRFPPSVLMDTRITQMPRHLVMGMRSKKSLKCKQHLGHNSMYWYKQSAQKPPELMFVYNYKELVENNTVQSRFSPECPDNSQLYLHLDALEPEDSAMYLCASSKDTALQSHLLPVQKPPGSSQETVGQPRLGSAFPVRAQTEISEHSAACQFAGYDNVKSHADPTACGLALS